MKKTSKALALALALVMTLSLSACSAVPGMTMLAGDCFIPNTSAPSDFAERIETANEKMAALNSWHTDMTLELGMTLSASGQSVDTDITMSLGADITKDPPMMKMELKVEEGPPGDSEEESLLGYLEQRDGAVMLYFSSIGGKAWQSVELKLPPMGQADGQTQVIQTYSFALDTDRFLETGRDSVDGREIVLYSGVIPGEDLKEGIESLAQGGASFPVDDMIPMELFEDIGDVPMTVGFDAESGYLVLYEIDALNALQPLASVMQESMLGEENPISIQFNTARLKIAMSGFDEVTVEIPEAVRAAAGAGTPLFTEDPTAAAAPEEEGAPLGKISYRGGAPRYENPALGFGCQLDLNWAVATKAGTARMESYVFERYEGSEYEEAAKNSQNLTVFYATRNADPAAVSIQICKLPLAGGFDPEEIAAYDATVIKEQMKAAGIKVLEAEKNQVLFAGRETAGLSYHILDHGESYYYQTIYYAEGEYLVIVTLGAAAPETLWELTEKFFPLP